jgi:hypothetical protein
LPEDRVSFGGYKMRIYLGSDEMPSPSEQRRARNGGAASRTPAPSPARPAAQGLYPSLTKATVKPPGPAPRAMPASFPEPSHDNAPLASWDDTAYEPEPGHAAGAAEPIALNGGLELVDDDAHTKKPRKGTFEGAFELIEDDDDDEIIDLE